MADEQITEEPQTDEIDDTTTQDVTDVAGDQEQETEEPDKPSTVSLSNTVRSCSAQ